MAMWKIQQRRWDDADRTPSNPRDASTCGAEKKMLITFLLKSPRSSSRPLLFFVLPIILGLLAPAVAEDIDNGICSFTADYCWSCSGTDETFNNASIYTRNLNTLLSSFSSNKTQFSSGFYNSSLGQDPEKVNAMALCRGDVPLNDCRTCFNESISILLQNCTNKKQAIIWAQRCMVRYSNVSIFGVEEDDPVKFVPGVNNAPNAEQFKLVLNPLLETLREKAAAGDSITKFAAGHALFPATNQIIYAIVQCTPDLDRQNCSDCLEEAISDIPKCCEGKEGGRILRPSCNLRFDVNLFYDAAADSPVNLPGKQDYHPSRSPTRPVSLAPLVVMAMVVSLIILTVKGIYSRVGKTKKISGSISEYWQFDYSTISVATNNFSQAKEIGQGSCGVVYKGRLSNGKDIAVKRLLTDSELDNSEFKNLILTVTKLYHRNLIGLLGFCWEGSEMILVYEFAPNRSLDYAFDPVNHLNLDWDMRYNIIVGIARGLLYLHEDSPHPIVHGDLKASNILIDAEMNPKISDVGMSKLHGIHKKQGGTEKFQALQHDYLAINCEEDGDFSVKSDIYSFGVLVLEIMIGRESTYFNHGGDGDDLLSYAWQLWTEGRALHLIDDSIETDSRTELITRCIHIGLLCVQENIADRPTMGSVILMLNMSYQFTLPPPTPPATLRRDNTKELIDSTSRIRLSNKRKPYWTRLVRICMKPFQWDSRRSLIFSEVDAERVSGDDQTT